MSGAATIIFAREDLSVPGGPEGVLPTSGPAGAIRDRFFNLVRESEPDVIVIDFSGAPLTGADTILAIRQRTGIPILVICDPAHPLAEEYRIAGAAGCIAPPVDIVLLNQSIQKIIRVMRRGRSDSGGLRGQFLFAGLSFQPGRNVLAGDDGSTMELTTSEARLLTHFLSKPWTLCTRTEIGDFLYGDNHTVGDRALNVIVTRLRKKLLSLGGTAAEHLIKTEFRRGYLLLCDVTTVPYGSSRGTHAPLAAVN